MDADLQAIKDYIDANYTSNHAQAISGPIGNSSFTQLLTAIQDSRGLTTQIAFTVEQAGHGFSVGNAVYHDGTIYKKARANSTATVGIFIVVLVEAEFFRIVQVGLAEGLSSLTPGSLYFVSQATAGALTLTRPTTGIVNPVLLALTASTGYVLPYRYQNQVDETDTDTVKDKTVSNAQAKAWEAKIDATEKAAANGVATLDAGTKIPIAQLPAAVVGAMQYQGVWNATTNTPELVSSTGTTGHYYTVNVAGTTEIDGEADWQAKDNIVFNGTVWEKIDNTDEEGGGHTIADEGTPITDETTLNFVRPLRATRNEAESRIDVDIVSLLNQKTVYVANGGTDAVGYGSIIAPYATVAYALTQITSEETIDCTITNASAEVTGVAPEDIAKLYIGQQVFSSTSTSSTKSVFITAIAADSFTMSEVARANAITIDICYPHTIIVRTGVYAITATLNKPGVNFHFEAGAVVTTASSIHIFTVTTNKFDFKCTGYGTFYHKGTGSYYIFYYFYTNFVNAIFEFDQAISINTVAIYASQATSGISLVIKGNYVLSQGSYAMRLRGYLIVNILTIKSTANYAVHVDDGTISKLTAVEVISTTSHCIYGQGIGLASIYRLVPVSVSYGMSVKNGDYYMVSLTGTIIGQAAGSIISIKGLFLTAVNNGSTMFIDQCNLISGDAGVSVVNKLYNSPSYGRGVNITGGTVFLFGNYNGQTGYVDFVTATGGKVILSGISGVFGYMNISNAELQINNCNLQVYGSSLAIPYAIKAVTSSLIFINNSRIALMATAAGLPVLYLKDSKIVINGAVFAQNEINANYCNAIQIPYSSTTEAVKVLSAGLSLNVADENITTGTKRKYLISCTADLLNSFRLIDYYGGTTTNTITGNSGGGVMTAIDIAAEMVAAIVAIGAYYVTVTDNLDGTFEVEEDNAGCYITIDTPVVATVELRKTGCKPFTNLTGGTIIADVDVE